MQEICCLYPMVFFLPILMIVLGLIYIFNKDRAWRIAESMLKSVKPQRTPEWEYYATINGLIMTVGGIVILVFLLSKLLAD